MSEQTPLLAQSTSNNEEAVNGSHSDESSVSQKDFSEQRDKIRRFVTGPLLFLLLAVMLVLVFFNGDTLHSRWLLRGDPHTAAKRILARWPVIVSTSNSYRSTLK